jgi:cytochrome P450
MLHEPEEFARLRATIDPLMDKVKDDIMNKMDSESVQELDFVKYCYLETMRRTFPANSSSTSCFTKDLSICGIDVKAGEAFYVYLEAIGNDPEQWKDAELFKPDRFDS